MSIQEYASCMGKDLQMREYRGNKRNIEFNILYFSSYSLSSIYLQN